MDAFSEKQIALLTQHSTALLEIERECLTMRFSIARDISDLQYLFARNRLLSSKLLNFGLTPTADATPN